MSEEVSSQGNGVGAFAASMMFPGMPGSQIAFGSITSVKRAKGIKKAVSELEIENFKRLNATLKNGTHQDVFSRGLALSENYEKLRGAQKSAYKTGKQLAKLEKRGDISLFEKFKNFFRKAENKVTYENTKNVLSSTAKKNADNLKDINKTLKAGSEIVESGTKAGFGNTLKGLFKKEIKSKFNFGISVLTTFVPAMVEKAIPAFKEKGLVAGLKETGKAVIQTASDFVSYGFGGAIGRAGGYAIGALLAPVTGGLSAFFGGTIGDILGSMLIGGKICKTVDKVIGADKEPQQQADEALAANNLPHNTDVQAKSVNRYNNRQYSNLQNKQIRPNVDYIS